MVNIDAQQPTITEMNVQTMKWQNNDGYIHSHAGTPTSQALIVYVLGM